MNFSFPVELLFTFCYDNYIGIIVFIKQHLCSVTGSYKKEGMIWHLELINQSKPALTMTVRL